MKGAAVIICRACGTESVLKREPKYEGFKKVGETLRCAACGHVYAGEEEVPYKQHRRPAVFDDAEAPRPALPSRDEPTAGGRAAGAA